MLSNVLKRFAVPPNSHGNDLSYWSIDPNKVILPNLRLGGVGATQDGGADVFLPRCSGVDEIIENVYVELDTEKIADNQNLALYASMFNMMIQNRRQKNVSTVLRRTELGSRSRYVAPTNSWGTDAYVKAQIFPAERAGVQTNQLTGNSATTATGLVHLSDFIEFLNSADVKFLPYLPNLKITVEWKDLTRADVLRYTTAPTGYTILKPKLIYDEVIDQASLKSIPRGFKTRYLEPVFEYQTLSAVANGVTARETITTQGFDGKYLEDLAISLEAVTDDTRNEAGLGFNSSIAQKGEKIMLVLNGANHLPEEGLDTSAKKQLYQAVTRGALCVPYSGYQYAVEGAVDYLDEDFLQMASRQSYTTIGVGAPVGSLTVQYTRTGTDVPQQSGALYMNMFGRVWRELEVTPEGRALLSYVPGF